MIPGWYGVGTGLQAAVDAYGEDALAEMARDWPFFKTFLDDVSMVLAKGEHDAGTIMVVTCEKGRNNRAWERMPQADGTRKWTCSHQEDAEIYGKFTEFVDRRIRQDPDLWIVELDIADGERFIR